jgi:hypothetical protein
MICPCKDCEKKGRVKGFIDEFGDIPKKSPLASSVERVHTKLGNRYKLVRVDVGE